MWGQQLQRCPSCRLCVGTPPRMWGQHRSVKEASSARNTPTYVGTTGVGRGSGASFEEHPHVCGDNLKLCRGCNMPFGTPPRMWGQRLAAKRHHRTGRNTPTYVGTTIAHRLSCTSVQEHPHVCGDNRGFQRCSGESARNTPTYVGTTKKPLFEAVRARNTPTYVGTTGFYPCDPNLHTEHPHVCGDNAERRRRRQR